ncbi:MAG: U32 family peptidase [Corallococcus sp.]|nr:U32 family peptidase [Corallococcus sp.]MCM1359180.1 U32 family peptidase [Corallococcus sp.]MCM1394570.1 U32 family peptidase [Corallococcus sp.]
MKPKIKNWEILAPAGSIEQLTAAVHNGCDSVYLGLDCFNARMRAPNFNADNLGYWIDFCHFFGVKVYVAVNTSVKNNEVLAAKQAIFCAYKNNADGVIVTDLALIRYASSLPKPFEVVASTQLNVHDKYGAEFLKRLGASTVVCARESTLDEIREIAETGVNVECFVHGAVCVCQSGQCLFSSMVGGNSGNRGLCAQPCRKLYKANEGRFVKGGYLLSASDICSLDTAGSLIDAGATVFKIEGRNRRAEYAAVTSRTYSKLFIDAFCYDPADRTDLLEAYNRGGLPSNNYLFGKNDNIIYPYAQNHIGRRVGVVRGDCIFCEAPIEKGDGLKIFDGNREVCGGLAITGGVSGDNIKAEFSGFVRDGFTVCRTASVVQGKDSLSSKRTRRVSLKFVAFPDKTAVLTANSENSSVQIKSDFIVQKAQRFSLSEDEIRSQLSKTGDFYYTITDVAIEADGIFLAKSQLNALRRSALRMLSEKIVNDYNSKFDARLQANTPEKDIFLPACGVRSAALNNCLAVICSNADEMKSFCDKVDYIFYKPSEISRKTLEKVGDTRCYLDLPPLCNCEFIRNILPENMGLVCHNIGHVEFARRENLSYVAGAGLNIFNDVMANEFADADTFVYSQELSLAEIADFENKSGLVFVDGELVLMKVTHCPYKLNFGCDCRRCDSYKSLKYVDEQGNQFTIKKRKDARCSFEVINGKKLSIANKLRVGGRYLIDCDETVVQHYLRLNNGIDDGFCETEPYTKGRLYNKIN